jgi:glycolate oxidase FAD binding subunit
MATSLSNRLAASLGDDALVAVERLTQYAVDGIVPEVAVLPPTVEAVSETLSFASAHDKRVVPWGGGTQMGLGNTPRGVDMVLGLGRLDGVLFHEPGDLVASVQAGTTLQTLQDELRKHGQLLPIEAPFPREATVGGVLAANASGPSRLGYGTARDWLIGIRVVHSDGTVTKAGGRVVKNVTGYDLNKLYVGSLGTLGVIVEATFKLAPMPNEIGTMVATFSSLSAALRTSGEHLGQSSMPHAMQVINRDVMGRLPGVGSGEAALLVRFDGRTAPVTRRLDDLAQSLKSAGAVSVERLAPVEGKGLWQALTDLGWSNESPPYLAVKVHCLPSQLGEVLDLVNENPGVLGSPGIVADVGWGAVRLLWWGEDVPALDAISRLRRGTNHIQVHVVVERCSPEVKQGMDVWGEAFEGMEIMARIKQQLDPAGILNPGRFAGGL